jgi:hypothetical protein
MVRTRTRHMGNICACLSTTSSTQAIKRATKTAIALNGLRHMRPEQMRQLYQACVTPTLDYLSTVWHDPLRDKTHLRHLNTVQRTVLIRVLSAFRTVATATLEVEAHVVPTHLRLRHRAQCTIARLHTLPRDHPIRNALSRAENRTNNVGSYARFPLAEAMKTVGVDRLNELGTIETHAHCHPGERRPSLKSTSSAIER